MDETVEKKGMSSGAKWGVGCGVGCLVIIILLGVGGFIAWRIASGKLDQMTEELKALGFETVVTEQMIDRQETLETPTLFIGQQVKLLGDVTTNVAILAQMGEIHGTVQGKVYFRGQMLVVQPQAVIEGGLDVQAQVVQNHGEINGGITGSYATLQGNPAEE